MSFGAPECGPTDMDRTIESGPLLDLINGCWTTQALCAGVELGVFDALDELASTGIDLAQRLGTDADATSRLLAALASLGVCSRSESGIYRLTDRGRLLSESHPNNLQGWALLTGRTLWDPWHGLAESVRTGRPHHRSVGETDRFHRLDHNDDEALVFQRAMAATTRALLPTVVPAISEHLRSRSLRTGTAVDVGAGHGEFLAALLGVMPDWTGIAYDLRYAGPFVERTFRDHDLGTRARFEPGSFFEHVPAADAILLKSILHDWDDARAVGILTCCERALSTNGVIAIVERLLPEHTVDSTEHRRLTRADLNMLVGPGGRERSLQEFENLLHVAGLRMSTHQPVGGGFSVVFGAH